MVKTRCGRSCDFETGQVAYGRHQLRCFIGHDQTISETLDQGGNAPQGFFAYPSGLESTLAVVIKVRQQARRLKSVLNIDACLALLHALHLAKPRKAQRRRS